MFACLWALPQLAWAYSEYHSCAAENKFPPTALPHQLTTEQKQLLVACADARKHAPLADWVSNVFREEIRDGTVKAPIDWRKVQQAKLEKQLDGSSWRPQSDWARFLWKAGAWLAFGMFLVVLWKSGPMMLVIGACGLVVFAVFGATVGAGKGMFDEMGGMYPAFAVMFAMLLLVVAGVWFVIRARRKDDDD